MKTFLMTLAVFFIVATLLPLVRHEAWWIRIFDFPRAQIAVAGFLITAAYLYAWDTKSVIEDIILGALVLCVGYQAVRMFPYTTFAPKQVKWAESRGSSAPGDSTARLSILIANVLMENRSSDRFLELVRSYSPDLILTVETDEWWADELSALDEDYPYGLKHPLPNTYGMILHSRVELINPEVKYVVEDSIPSIHAGIRLTPDVEVRLYCLHPRPPYPKEDTSTIQRDAELLIVGREVRELARPAIVIGDMNDVAWSHTTKLFQRISGLLDPRIGRGMYNSFGAGNFLLRWPLDHIFHSEHFGVVDLQRLPDWGSDHFPIFAHLEYSPTAASGNDKPQPEGDDEEEASEKIEEGNEAE